MSDTIRRPRLRLVRPDGPEWPRPRVRRRRPAPRWRGGFLMRTPGYFTEGLEYRLSLTEPEDGGAVYDPEFDLWVSIRFSEWGR